MKQFNKISLSLVVVFSLLLGAMQVRAQVTGTKSIPGDYATLAAAITDLNTNGVGAGGATINLTTTETAPTGGYLIGSATLNASTSAANPLVINGAGNLITAQAAGTGLGTSATLPDAIVIVAGTDYITLNQLNIVENVANTTLTTQMEAGILIRSLTTADACHFITIQNCTINLNGVASLTSSSGIYETGISVQTMPYTQAVSPQSTTAIAPTSADGSPSDIVIKGNTIQNCFNGIAVIGNSSAGNQTANVMIGGISPADGNVLTGLGSKAPEATSAITSNAIGIFVVNTLGSEIRHNDLTATSIFGGIYFIQGSAEFGSRVMSNNTIQGSSLAAAAFIYSVFNSPGGTSTNSNVDSNIVQNITMSGTGNFYGIFNSVTSIAGNHTTNGNQVINFTKNAGGACFGIFSSALMNTGFREMKNNIVNNFNIVTSSTTATQLNMMYATNSQPMTCKNNIMSNVNVSGIGTGAVTIYGLYNNMTVNNHIVDSNRISNFAITSTTPSAGNVYGMFSTNASGNINFNGNNIHSLSTSTNTGNVNGILMTGNAPSRLFTNNFISNLSAPSISGDNVISGINITGGPNNMIYNNTVNLGVTAQIASSGANFGVSGISWTGGTIDIRNNILKVDAATSGNAITAALRGVAAGTLGTVPSTYSATSNNNIFYAPNTTKSFLYAESALNSGTFSNAYNLTNDATFNTACGVFKTFASPRESSTFTENNLIVGTSVNTYMPTGSTYAESGGQSLVEVPSDYDGVARGILPDLGALEFTGINVDASAPAITYSALENTLCLVNRTFTADILDVSGVNTTSGTRPRVWFKKSTETNVLPVSNTSTDNGWKYVEASNTTSPFSFTIDYSLLNSPLVGGDIIEYFVVAEDISSNNNVGKEVANFATGFCPSSVTLGAAAFPVTGTNSYTINVPPANILTVSTPNEFCVSGAPVLNTTNDAIISGMEYQWQWSPSGQNTWTNVPGGTTLPFTSPSIVDNTDYQLVISCNGTPFATSNVVTTIVNNPLVATTTPATICGPHTATISATTAGGYNIRWYDAPVGGTLLHIGNSYTTPTLNSTTTYYSLAAAGSSVFGGRITNPTGGSPAGSVPRGLLLNATNPVTIDSIGFLSTGTATSVTLQLYNSAGTAQIGSDIIVNIPSNGGTTTAPQLVTLPTSIVIPAAGTYRLFVTALNPTGSYLFFESTSVTGYPYAVGPDLNITSSVSSLTGGASTSAYYYVYKLSIGQVCEGVRTPVEVTYNPPPALNLTASADSICFNGTTSSNIDVTSSNPNYTYTWLPTTGLNTASGPNVVANPLVSTTYTVTATDAGTGCLSAITKSVGVLPSFTMSASVSPNLVCAKDSATLTSVASPSGFVPSSYSWLPAPGIANPTSASSKANTYYTTTYTVVASNSYGCSATATTTLSVHPLITGTPTASPSSFCVGGSTNISSTVTSTCFGSTPNFAGPYAPFYWTLVNATSNGTVNTVGAPNSIIISSGNNQGSGAANNGLEGTTSYRIVITCPGTVSFNWNYATADIPYLDRPRYKINSGTPIQFTGFNEFGFSPQSGTQSITVNGGDTLYLQMWSFDNDGVSGFVTLTNFSAPAAAITGTLKVWDAAVGGNNLGTPPLTVTPVAGAQYFIEFTQNITGCVNPIRELVPLTVNALPTVMATASPSTAICSGNPVTLQGTGAQDYQWDGTPTLTGDTTLNPAVAGTYVVLGTDANNCSATSSVTITINPTPTITATPLTQTVCENELVTVAGGGAGIGGSYSWSGGITDNTPFVVTTSDTYTVTGMDASGCTNTATSELIMNPAPIIAGVITPAVTCNNTSVTPQGFGAGIGGSYSWSGGLTDNTSFLATNTGSYTMTGTDANGCSATTSVTLFVNNASTDLALATSGNALSTSGNYCMTQNQFDNSTLTYYDASCNIIAEITASGGNTLGDVTACVDVSSAVQTYNGQPYLARTYIITPTSQGPATITLYYTQDDFDDYNASAGSFPQITAIPGQGATASFCISQVPQGTLPGANGANTTVHNVTATWNVAMNRWEVLLPVSSFSGFYCHACNPGNSALPVSISNFTGRKLESSDELSWTTMNEQNNSFFNVQHSTDGITFKTISKVNSKAPNGTSSYNINYTATNTNPSLGHNYYRLQQVDIDGRSSMHNKVIDIVWGADGNTVSIYPNPTKDILNIDLYSTKVQNTTIKVMDMSGRIVKQIQAISNAGMNNISLSIGGLSSGIYTIQVLENDRLTFVSKVKKND